MGLAIICPGQGSQTATMFAPLQDSAEAAPILDFATQQLGFDLKYPLHERAIHLNRIAQPLLCAYTLATWQALVPLLNEQKPSLFLGYSIGEVCAHALAGSIPPREALMLCAKRAQAMDAAVDSPQAMAAIRGLSRTVIDDLCITHQTEIAILNGPHHFVLGGRAENVEALCNHVEATVPGQIHRLKVTVASHTSLLVSATREFSEILATSEFKKPMAPVVAGIDASPVKRPREIQHTLTLQLSRPVQWERCLLSAHEMGATCFLELSPGRAMTQISRELLPEVPARSIADFRGLEGAVAWAKRNSYHP